VAEQLPSVPASLLLYTDGANAATSQAYSNGSGIDMQFNGGAGLREYYGEGSTASAYADIFRTFADKGYSLWLWTYETDTMPEALRNGVTGITTNDAAITGSHVEKLFPQKTYEVKKSACGRRKDFGKGKDVCGRGKDGRGESGLAGKAGNGRHGGTCLRIGARYLPDQRKRKIYGERRQRLRFVGGRAFVGRSRRRGGFRGAGKQEEKIRHGKKTIEIFGGRGERPVIRRNVFRLSVRGFFRFGRQKIIWPIIRFITRSMKRSCTTISEYKKEMSRPYWLGNVIYNELTLPIAYENGEAYADLLYAPER